MKAFGGPIVSFFVVPAGSSVFAFVVCGQLLVEDS